MSFRPGDRVRVVSNQFGTLERGTTARVTYVTPNIGIDDLPLVRVDARGGRLMLQTELELINGLDLMLELL